MKTAKRALSVLLAFLMVFGAFGVVGSAKGNPTTTIAALNDNCGKVTYGLDVYKVTPDGEQKVEDGGRLSPGDVVNVVVSMGTDFYTSLISTEILFDSNYFEPWLGKNAFTEAPTNTFETGFNDNTGFIKRIIDPEVTETTVKGHSYHLFDTVAPVDVGGYSGLVNKNTDNLLKGNFPLSWHIPNAQGRLNASCELKDEYKSLRFVSIALTMSDKAQPGAGELIKIPYAPYFSFQLHVKDNADSNGAATSIFIPIEAAKRDGKETCNKLYAYNSASGYSATSGIPMFGQEYDTTNADLDFVIGAPACEHTYGDPVWVWDSDYAFATAMFTCTKCGADTQSVVDNSPVLTEVSPATCTADQVIKYVATVTFNDTKYTDETDPITVPESMADHEYGEPVWSWAEGYTSATATFTCLNCPDSKSLTDEAPAQVEVSAAGCEDEQTIKYVASVTFNGTEYTDETDPIIVPDTETGHDYGEPVWSWAGDYSSATATFTCSKCKDVKTITTDNVDVNVVSQPDCENDQVVKYTASVEFEDTTYYGESEDVTEEGTALGHSYGDPVWSWAEDYSTATATFTCGECNDVQNVVDDDVSVETVKDATCQNDQEITYTAAVEFLGKTYTDKQENIVVENTKLDHVPGDWEMIVDPETGESDDVYHGKYCENCDTLLETDKHDFSIDVVVTKEATEDEDGVKIVECKDCGYQHNEIIPALNHVHTYSKAPTWVWNSDYSIATATFTCDKEDYSVEVGAYLIDVVTVSAVSCTQDGIVKYVAHVNFNEVEYTDTTDEIKIADATGHSYGEPVWTWANDYSSVKADFTCDEGDDTFFLIDNAPVMIEVQPAGCETNQFVKYTATVSFEDVDYTTETDPIEVPDTATGHAYGEPTWSWAEDGSSATATFVCGNCQDVKEVTDGSPVETVVKPAACEVDQISKFTATVNFGGTEYSAESNEITIAGTALSHSFGAPAWSWAEDYSSATATFTCGNCLTTRSVTDNAPVMTEIKKAGCETDQIVKYTATVNFDGTEYTKETEEITVPDTATGHNYGEPVWVWTDVTSATATFTCGNCSDVKALTDSAPAVTVVKAATCTEDQIETYTATVTLGGKEYTDQKANVTQVGTALGHDYVKTETEPTCTEDGVITYTCSRCNDSYTEPGKPATGHTYGEPVWNWAADYSSATVTFTCVNGDDTKTETATVTQTEVSPATTTADQVVNYTATVTFGDKTYTKESGNVSVPGTKLPDPDLTLTENVGNTTGKAISLTVVYAGKGKTAAKLTPNKDGVKYEIDAKGSKFLQVDGNGNIIFKHQRLFRKTATITATAPDGKTATCQVTVKYKWWQYLIWLIFGWIWY